jgi:hypothetical protein
MINLQQVSKQYRTERIETTALDNINLESSSRSWALRVAARARCST